MHLGKQFLFIKNGKERKGQERKGKPRTQSRQRGGGSGPFEGFVCVREQ